MRKGSWLVLGGGPRQRKKKLALKKGAAGQTVWSMRGSPKKMNLKCCSDDIYNSAKFSTKDEVWSGEGKGLHCDARPFLWPRI